MTCTGLTITARAPGDCGSGDTSGGSGMETALTSNARSGGISRCGSLAGSALTGNTRNSGLSGVSSISRSGGLLKIHFAVRSLISHA